MPELTAPAIQRCLQRHTPWRLHVFNEVSSTNTVAIELAGSGAPAYTAVLADFQAAGRGRVGREWRTPRGAAIALSMLLRPASGPDWWPWIGLAAALATREAIEHVAGTAGGVKWPNDVVINNRKVAGVLMETRWHPGRPDSRWVVVGIGVNVNNRSSALPESFAASAISILDVSGVVTDRNVLAAEILTRFADYMAGLPNRSQDLEARWAACSVTSGLPVAVSTPAGLIEGLDDGLGAHGELMIRTRENETRSIHTGEVLLLRTVAPPVV